MKKSFIAALFLFASGFLFGQWTRDGAAFSPYFAFSYQPFSKWSFNQKSDYSERLSYSMNRTYYGRAEFDISHKSGLKLGFLLDLDDFFFTKTDTDNNFVDRLANIAGRLGYKNFLLMAGNSRLTGTGKYTTTGYYPKTEGEGTREFPFDHEFFALDMLYVLRWSEAMQDALEGFDSLFGSVFGWLFTGQSVGIGVNYTRFFLPFEFLPFDALDPKMKFSSYGFTLWGDSFFNDVQNGNNGPRLWYELMLRADFASLSASEEGKAALQSGRDRFSPPGDWTDEEVREARGMEYKTRILVQYEGALGGAFIFNMERLNFGVAAGWGVYYMSANPLTLDPGYPKAELTGIRHGFIIKGSLSF